jgi:hypothetical protein
MDGWGDACMYQLIYIFYVENENKKMCGVGAQ